MTKRNMCAVSARGKVLRYFCGSTGDDKHCRFCVPEMMSPYCKNSEFGKCTSRDARADARAKLRELLAKEK
jgi:hypothetical protein